MTSINYYSQLRAPYTPKNPKLVWLYESPPATGRYFYNPDGGVKSETLYREMMRLFGWEPKTKHEGLTCFRKAGMLLLDATYRPIDKIDGNRLTPARRRELIKEDYLSTLELLPGNVPIVIGAVTVLDAVGDLLRADGFEVLNPAGQEGRVPFAGFGQQGRFHKLVRPILERHNFI